MDTSDGGRVSNQTTIDLSADGLTRNDDRDPDSGPNGLQNYPILTSASRSGSKTTIRGRIGSTPNTNLTVQFFASPAPSSSGYGEGKRLLGKVQVRTNGSGTASLSYGTGGAPSGYVVSATATPGWYQSASGPTSEFSKAITVR